MNKLNRRMGIVALGLFAVSLPWTVLASDPAPRIDCDPAEDQLLHEVTSDLETGVKKSVRQWAESYLKRAYTEAYPDQTQPVNLQWSQESFERSLQPAYRYEGSHFGWNRLSAREVLDHAPFPARRSCDAKQGDIFRCSSFVEGRKITYVTWGAHARFVATLTGSFTIIEPNNGAEYRFSYEASDVLQALRTFPEKDKLGRKDQMSRIAVKTADRSRYPSFLQVKITNLDTGIDLIDSDSVRPLWSGNIRREKTFSNAQCNRTAADY